MATAEITSSPSPRPSSKAGLPPGHRVPGWLNVIRLLRNMKGFQAANHKKYGPNFVLRLPLLPPIVIVGGPDLAKAAFAQKNEVLDAYPNSVIHFVTGESAFIYAEGKKHARERRRLNPHLLGKGAALRWPEIIDRLEHDLASWPEETTMSLHFKVKEAVSAAMIRRFLALPPEREEELIENSLKLTDALLPHLFFLALLGIGPSRERPNFLLSVQRRIIRFLSYFVPGYRGLVNLRNNTFERFFDEAVKTARDGTDPDGFLAQYLASLPEGEDTPTDEELGDLLATLVLVGVDSTSTTTSWCLHYLMNDDALRERILAEAAAAGINELRDCNPQSLAACRELDHVVSEVLRVRTPTPLTARRACEPLELAGYKIPAGMWMMISIYRLHHHTSEAPKIDEFRPERFDSKVKDLDTGKAYCPFGAGAHKCPGSDLSMLVIKSIVLTTCLRWEMTPCEPEDGVPPDKKSRTLRFANLTPPGDLPITIRRRGG